jgi:hypothetical protein
MTNINISFFKFIGILPALLKCYLVKSGTITSLQLWIFPRAKLASLLFLDQVRPGKAAFGDSVDHKKSSVVFGKKGKRADENCQKRWSITDACGEKIYQKKKGFIRVMLTFS